MSDARPLEPNLTGAVQRHRVPLRRRLLQIVRTEDLAPGFRRIVLSGDDLEQDFPFAQFAPGDHVKVILPDPEGNPDPIMRDYTVRDFAPDARELTIEFVLHQHGPAGQWAATATPGDPVGIAGPRGHKLLPQNYGHYLIAGDESALPALARFLAEAPASATVTAVISVADASAKIPLTARAGQQIIWVERNRESPAAGDTSALETRIRSLSLPADLFIFAAGEATALKPIRRYFRFERDIPRQRVMIDGYWKQGVAALDHHANEVGDD